MSTIALTAVSAQTTVIVTPGNMHGWTNGDTTPDSVSAITPLFPRNGNGSAQLTTTTAGKASFENYWNPLGPNPFGTTTTIGNLDALSMDYYRSSTSLGPDSGAPALRFFFNDGMGNSGSLVFEAVYNGPGPGNPIIPTDTWLNVDFLNSKLWMRSNGANHDVVGGFLTLSQWLDPNVDKPTGAYTLTNDFAITGVQFSYGSGAGQFNGAADNVDVAFGGGNNLNYNFEVVPEPSSVALMVGGLGLLAAFQYLRRKRPLSIG